MYLTNKFLIAEAIGDTSHSNSLSLAILSHLAEPFVNQDEAKTYWQECAATLLLIQNEDELSLLPMLADNLIQQVLHCFDHPEYVDPLPHTNFSIRLAILNDEGQGIYIVYPTDLDFGSHTFQK